MTTLISVVIVNFNGLKWLSKCLDSLSKQTFKSFEIIFVDNGSTDGSVKFVKKNFPGVKIVMSKYNLGFAGGSNLGFRKAKGKYILLLNNDTYVEKGFLNKFISGFEKHPKAGILQSKIVWMDQPEKIDSCGSYWTDSSFMYYVGNNKDASQKKYDKPFPVFSVKGASVMIKRDLIEKIGLFDDDYWSYYEETDLCHRAWLSGYESWYFPEPVCYHAIGGTSLTFKNDFIQFHNFKNKLASFISNFEFTNLIIVTATFILMNILLSMVWLLQGKYKHSLALLKAIVWNIKNIRKTLNKRKKVQSSRVLRDLDYLNVVKKNPGIIYFCHLFRDDLGSYKDLI